MKSISEAMKAYMLAHPFDFGNPDCKTVLDQLYHAYAESHEYDPQEIGDGFKELEEYLCVLPLDNSTPCRKGVHGSSVSWRRPQVLGADAPVNPVVSQLDISGLAGQ